MIIDTALFFICITLLTVAVISPLFSPFNRLRTEEGDIEDGEKKLPPLTILLTPHKQGIELEKNVPLMLAQDYPAPIEIIIVVERGDIETEDALKRLSKDKRVYGTFIPERSRYMSRKKLAITLGVKASHHEWIIMTDANNTPESDQWLKTMARHCTNDIDFVLGYSNYESSACSFYRFERLYAACYLFREATKGTAYRTNSTNLLFRKAIFTEGDGYRGNLDIGRGEYDFLVNKYAREGRSVIELSPMAWMTEESPVRQTWRSQNLYYIHIRQFLKRNLSHRLLPFFDEVVIQSTWLILVTALLYGCISITTEGIETKNAILTLTAFAALIANIILRALFSKRVIRYFKTQLPLWCIPFYEMKHLWHCIYNLLRYKFSDKTDYTTHKL